MSAAFMDVSLGRFGPLDCKAQANSARECGVNDTIEIAAFHGGHERI